MKKACNRWRMALGGHHGLLAAGILLLGLMGCGGGDQSSPVSPPGLLRVGTPMQVRVANPLVDYSYNIFAMLATHDTLVRFDEHLRPLPQLALAWESDSDGRRWRFRLREDAHWHDGKPVTPEDVKFTFEYQAAHHGALAWLRTLIKDITIQGQTVSFELTKPHGHFLINCGFIVRILPKHVWESVEDPFKPGDARVTLGSGPFVFEKLDLHAGRLLFKRNETYHGPLSTVERLDVFLNRSFDALALALQRGDLDLYYKYASGFPPAYLTALSGKDGLSFPAADAMGIPAALGFNLGRQPMEDLVFRKAIAAAIDYNRIGASLLGDSGKPPDTGFIPPAFANPLPDAPLTYTPQESERLLDEAGYTDADNDGLRNLPKGENLVLTLLCRGDLAGTDALLPILSHNLKAVGISLRIERVDLSTWIERVHAGRFDLVLFRTTPWGMVMDAGMGSGYFDSRRQGGGTLANVTDPVFHDLCDQLLSTTDTARQTTLQNAVQRYYAEHLPALALCWAINTYPIGNSWQDITINQIEGGLLNRQTFANIQYKKSDK